jgi:glutamate--cysteine ligase
LTTAGDATPIPDTGAAVRLIREATFRPASGRAFRIGVEAELLPIDRETSRIAAIPTVMAALAPLAATNAWRAVPTTKGAPAFDLPGGGRFTFEPGGQLEYAAPPFAAPSAALANLRAVLTPVTNRLADAGIDLYGLGIDPFNAPDDVPLQVGEDRYRRMDAYYARFGPAGARMMRQTASIQLSIDSACDQHLVWRVLNALAPVMVATFANSRRYAGRDSGYANFRSRTWQLLDRTRTGLPWQAGSPERHYAEFALDAPAMFFQDTDGEFHPFRHWVEQRRASPDALATHLSTLFPEVRPRRYFEVRSVDALPLSMYAAPVMMIAGLALDGTALADAADLLGEPDTAWLIRAARFGMRDATLAGRAVQVARLAVAACRNRPDLCGAADVDAAEAFFEHFTEQGRSPADAADAVQAASNAA